MNAQRETKRCGSVGKETKKTPRPGTGEKKTLAVGVTVKDYSSLTFVPMLTNRRYGRKMASNCRLATGKMMTSANYFTSLFAPRGKLFSVM